MKKSDLIKIIKKLSEGYLNKKIDGSLYSFVVESLISCNPLLGKNFEEFSDFLAQYHPKPDLPELYGDRKLTKRIKILLKIDEND